MIGGSNKQRIERSRPVSLMSPPCWLKHYGPFALLQSIWAWQLINGAFPLVSLIISQMKRKITILTKIARKIKFEMKCHYSVAAGAVNFLFNRQILVFVAVYDLVFILLDQ